MFDWLFGRPRPRQYVWDSEENEDFYIIFRFTLIIIVINGEVKRRRMGGWRWQVGGGDGQGRVGGRGENWGGMLPFIVGINKPPVIDMVKQNL